jgi:hypothetical protein
VLLCPLLEDQDLFKTPGNMVLLSLAERALSIEIEKSECRGRRAVNRLRIEYRLPLRSTELRPPLLTLATSLRRSSSSPALNSTSTQHAGV